MKRHDCGGLRVVHLRTGFSGEPTETGLTITRGDTVDRRELLLGLVDMQYGRSELISNAVVSGRGDD